MQTKLTLTIDKDVISKAKQYAQSKRKSVSRLVEEYLRNIVNTDVPELKGTAFDAPLTNKITGMFKEKYNGESYKELLESALSERNL